MKTFKKILQTILEDNGGGAVGGTPANSVSGGGIYGVRGNPDETVVNQAAHVKRVKEEEKDRTKPTPRKMFIATTDRSREPKPGVGRNVGRDAY